jgi:hypothetical protein
MLSSMRRVSHDKKKHEEEATCRDTRVIQGEFFLRGGMVAPEVAAATRFLGERMPLEIAVQIAPVGCTWSGTFEMTPSNSRMLPGKRSLRAAAAEVPRRGAQTLLPSRSSLRI